MAHSQEGCFWLSLQPSPQADVTDALDVLGERALVREGHNAWHVTVGIVS